MSAEQKRLLELKKQDKLIIIEFEDWDDSTDPIHRIEQTANHFNITYNRVIKALERHAQERGMTFVDPRNP